MSHGEVEADGVVIRLDQIGYSAIELLAQLFPLLVFGKLPYDEAAQLLQHAT